MRLFEAEAYHFPSKSVNDQNARAALQLQSGKSSWYPPHVYCPQSLVKLRKMFVKNRDCLGSMVASRLLSRAGGDEYVDKESEFLRRIIPGLEPDSRTINDTVPVLVSDPQDWYERSLHKKTLVVLEAALDFVKFAYIPEAMLISEGGIFDDITAASVTYRDFFEHLRPHGEFAASGSDYGGGSYSVSLAFDDPLYEQRQVLRNGVPSLFHNPAELQIRHFMVLESMVISPRVIDLKVAVKDTALGRALRGHLYQDFSSCGMTVPMLVGSRKGGDISDMDLVDTYRQFDRRFNADAARLRASHADQVKKRRIAHSRALVECGGIAPEETETIMEWRRRIHASKVQRLSTGFFYLQRPQLLVPLRLQEAARRARDGRQRPWLRTVLQ